MSSEAGDFSHELTSEYQAKMREVVDNMYTGEYLESLGDSEDVIRKESQIFMWQEFMFGTLPAIRQINLIYQKGDPYDRDMDLIVGLNQQIMEENKHARIWSNLAEQFGVSGDLVEYSPDDSMIKVCRKMVEWEEPEEVAAAFQCSTEVMAALKNQELASHIEHDYPHVADTLRKHVVADEGDHIHVGRKIIKRFASPEEFDKLRDIAQQKYEASLDRDKSVRPSA